MNPLNGSLAFDRIVVVGGGTAGWMSALALVTGLPGKTVEVIESDDIGIVGVGEATFPSIRDYNRLVGIDELDFLRATQGTFKLGIEFRDWHKRGGSYFHTFGDFAALSGPQSLWGQYRRLAEGPGALGELCLPTAMAMQGRFCVPAEGNGGTPFKYAYHFDAALYADFLRKLALSRGARRTEGKIVDIARSEDGGVKSLRLADGREVAGDFFVDCSGFGSLLLGRTLGEPFVDFSHWLPVDRAWACPCERTGGDQGDIAPYTRATALEAGWAWRIPLQNRTGHGHVFASGYIDEERAREQLLEQLDGKPLAEPRLLRFTSGHRARLWVRNVLALGLSSGFLEPLESTSIFLIQSGLGRLMRLLGSGMPVDSEAVAAYNTGAVRQYARIRDFIILHYCLTARDDSQLWRDMARMELPETLAFKLHAWRECGSLVAYDEEGFDTTSWLAIHAGMENWPTRTDPVLQELPRDAARRLLLQRRDAIAAIVGRLPSHGSYLHRALLP